jgi:hypothetical protein
MAKTKKLKTITAKRREAVEKVFRLSAIRRVVNKAYDDAREVALDALQKSGVSLAKGESRDDFVGGRLNGRSQTAGFDLALVTSKVKSGEVTIEQLLTCVSLRKDDAVELFGDAVIKCGTGNAAPAFSSGSTAEADVADVLASISNVVTATSKPSSTSKAA